LNSVLLWIALVLASFTVAIACFAAWKKASTRERSESDD